MGKCLKDAGTQYEHPYSSRVIGQYLTPPPGRKEPHCDHPAGAVNGSHPLARSCQCIRLLPRSRAFEFLTDDPFPYEDNLRRQIAHYLSAACLVWPRTYTAGDCRGQGVGRGNARTTGPDISKALAWSGSMREVMECNHQIEIELSTFRPRKTLCLSRPFRSQELYDVRLVSEPFNLVEPITR